jgi:hypothetical protein
VKAFVDCIVSKSVREGVQVGDPRGHMTFFFRDPRGHMKFLFGDPLGHMTFFYGDLAT